MDELRRWLAARLSPRTRVDDWRLDELIDAVNRTDPIYIQRAVRGEEADRNDLLAEAQNHWITITRSSKGSARPISTGGKGEGRWLDPDEQGHLEKTILRTTSTLRMHAFAEGLARLMAKEAPVQHIRAALLGSPMTRQEAEAFSRSPAMRLCTPDEVQRYGIPLVGHSWRLLSEDIDEFGVYRSWEFIVEPPGYIITGELVGDPPSEPQFIRVENGEPDLFVRDDSVLGEVLKVAEWLANRYLVDARHAVHLILVNSLPPISPIRPYPPPRQHWSEDPESPWIRTELTLVIDPWLPETALLRLYREARTQLHGRKSRSVSTRALSVFRFCIARIDDKPDWRQLLTEWDLANPNARFGKDRLDDFRATFKRAHRIVMGKPFPSRRIRGARQGSRELSA